MKHDKTGAFAEHPSNTFAALYEISRDLAMQHDPHALLNVLIERATTLLHRRTGAIFYYDAERNDLPLAAWKGPPVPSTLRVQMGESVAGQVALLRQPVIVNDYQHWEYRSRRSPGVGIMSAVGVPMLYRGDLVGVLIVHEIGAPSKPFSDKDRRLLSLFASQAATVVRNAQLIRETRQRLAELETINRISSILRAANSLQEMLPRVLEDTLAVFQTNAGAITLYQTTAGEFRPQVRRGWFDHLVERVKPPMGIASHVLATGEPYVTEDFKNDPLSYPLSRHQIPEGWGGVAVPIRNGSEVVGILFVATQSPRRLNPNEINLLITLAEIMGTAIHRMRLYEETRRQADDLVETYEKTLRGWSHALDLRDKETEGHTQRVTEMTLRLARLLGESEEQLVHLRRGALLHDIGKIGIPDRILLKPGPLTPDEKTLMKEHPAIAYKMLSPIPYLRPALDIPYSHHEHWDGQGYPRGLRGEEIPLAARIFAVVDVWDALRSDRPYRRAWSKAQALKYIESRSGKQFDPKVVAEFVKMIKKRE